MITIGIATTGDRPNQLDNVILSLMGQCDQINVYNNAEQPDLGALGKFKYPPKEGYWLLCDDDLIYPPDYVEKTIRAIDKYKCIISWHGRKLSLDATKYYGYPHQKEVRYFQRIDNAIELDTGGTGVMGFHTDYFKPEIWNKPYKICADLTFGLEAAKQGKIIISPPKKHLWIDAQEVQIKLMNELLGLKHGK